MELSACRVKQIPTVGKLHKKRTELESETRRNEQTMRANETGGSAKDFSGG